MGKKLVDIERLLQWAYREELPKQAVGGLTGWERLIFLGTRVDTSYQETTFPPAMGAAHPDALLVDRIVRHRLPERVKLEWPRACDELMGELACWLADDEPLLVHAQAEPIALVMAHARMGTRPRWNPGPFRLTRIIGKNGKAVVDGITPGRRYSEGARCPLKLELRGRSNEARTPLPVEIACDRFQYRVWHAALTALSSESWILSEHTPLPSPAASHPWQRDDEIKPVIHREVSTRRDRVPQAEQRAC